MRKKSASGYSLQSFFRKKKKDFRCYPFCFNNVENIFVKKPKQICNIKNYLYICINNNIMNNILNNTWWWNNLRQTS